MSDDTITVEIDGQSVSARPGQMLIELTDANGTYVPRFCYHHKLSVAANCRMCLVEVEKAPKPLPACATPVMDGMVVKTKSAYARDAQKSVMEFLLINHPLDCPICDQGGECELQDLAMGYGSDVSRYQEKKRVVKDKNIGSLVQTEMTRCIHCTRCVRFGEEIAGLRELGATGRGEDMEIGTYVEKSMSSELSGNIIDLCPVGALTSKPFRFSARTWEMKQLPGVAPHDALGSNVHFHVKNDVVKRVVPAENESINEVWLSDRDRFSYEGLYSQERLRSPMIKSNGEWQETDWETALDAAARQLKRIIDKDGGQSLGTLVSASSSSEELYLLQKIVRQLGSENIDHRLEQIDFTADASAPLFPWLGQKITDIENCNAVLVVGSNLRKELPLLNLRVRKAALKGAAVMQLNPCAYDFSYDLSAEIIVSPAQMTESLAGILKALIDGENVSNNVSSLLASVDADENQKEIARQLKEADSASILLGAISSSHPQFSELCALADLVAEHSGAVLGFTTPSANSAGAMLCGAVPNRDTGGLNAAAMLENKLPAYLLYNVEPDIDCWNAQLAREALDTASCVVSFSAFISDAMRDYADILLPLAIFAENEGSQINLEGQRQSFNAVVSPTGEARPGWKVLRVLGNKLELDGYDYNTLDELTQEMSDKTGDSRPDNNGNWSLPAAFKAKSSLLQRFSEIPTNCIDPLVRRAQSLQKTQDVGDGAVHVNANLARTLGLSDAEKVTATQDDASVVLPLIIDDRLADNTVLIHGKQAGTAGLGGWFSEISLGKG